MTGQPTCQQCGGPGQPTDLRVARACVCSPGAQPATRPGRAIDPTLLRSLAVCQTFLLGAVLIEAGRPADALYLIQSGQVRDYRLATTGREVTTALLGPGQVCGLAVLAGAPTYHSFVEALTPIEAWRFPADQLLVRLPEYPALSVMIIRALTRRLLVAEDLLGSVGLLPVAERLPRVLTKVAGCLGGERPRITAETLAGLIGAQRETVSRAVRRSSCPTV